MEHREQHARIRRNYFNTLHHKIKDNPEIFDFYSNLGSSALTLLALGATIYFSLSALSKTDIQNQNAVEQLKEAKAQLVLAQQQFQYSKQLHVEESISSNQKDAVSNERFIKDTIKQGQRERAQEGRNQLQDAANGQQFNLNKSQLKAIQTQAKIAESQFYQQQDQYKQQLYEQRSVLNIDSVHVDSINSPKSTIQFYFSNKGYRPAHVDSTVLAFYNPSGTCFSVTKNGSNLDLISRTNFLSTSQVNIWNDCLKNNLTIYYLLIYYKDKISGDNQVEPIFFRYGYLHHQFFWTRVFGRDVDDFKAKLKRKNIFFIE